MDASHFDRVARLFADRRISRRAAMRQGGVGLAAAGLAAAGLSAAAAQDATPAPSGEKGEDDPTFLFVQSFQAGTLVPKEGSSDTFALTLEQGLGHTVYFSDRPERIVGAASTATFLTQFPFGEDNPPNAALVVETSPGETDVVVVELTAPAYDEATHTASYEAKLLADYQELGTTFQEEPKGAEDVPALVRLGLTFHRRLPRWNGRLPRPKPRPEPRANHLDGVLLRLGQSVLRPVRRRQGFLEGAV